MPVDPHLLLSQFSGPTPGQSWTHEPKSMPWQTPPQHTRLEDVMQHLFEQLVQPEHLKQLLGMMEAGMPIEAITRTILFTGFSLGKWTPDLGLLMYKPLMLLLITMAHKAGIKEAPIVMKESMDKHLNNKMKTHVMIQTAKNRPIGMLPREEPQEEPAITPSGNGFMAKGGC